MVYAEYLAFWIILLPFFVQNGFVETQEMTTTEIFETLSLNDTESMPETTGFTKISIVPSTAIAPSTLTTATVTAINSTVPPNTVTAPTIFEILEDGARLPTDAILTSKLV